MQWFLKVTFGEGGHVSEMRPQNRRNILGSRRVSVSDSSLRILVTGLIAQYPLGGLTWHYLQYPVGLMRMGHDVHYIEDTGQWPYNPMEEGISKGCTFNVAYLAEVMKRFGLGDRWAYRFRGGSEWYGLDEQRLHEIVHGADIVLNVSGVLEQPGTYVGPRSHLAFVDTDPVFTQLKVLRGQREFGKLVDQHDCHFTFGENIPRIEGLATGHDWIATRQPVVRSEWDNKESPRESFTTVMNWTSYKPIPYSGKTYGQKDLEFRRFLDLPARVEPTPLELAIGSGKTSRTPYDLLRHKGWHVVDPVVVCPDFASYRRYLQTSRGEWSVAKNGYVEGRSGWFSDRSACYLAAGRPVVVQDTGFTSAIPAGEGIVVFQTLDEATAAIQEVDANYARHASAALEIADEYFDAERVLGHIVETVMV